MADDAVARKQQVRTAVLAARGELSSTAREKAGAAITSHGLAQLAGVGTIAAYFSVGSEPPTHDLLAALAASGTRVLLPVVNGVSLDWAPYGGPAELTPRPHGLIEPTTARLGADAVVAAAAVVVPALAVDQVGNRLGRGRGFYDRALLDVAVPVIAVVYDDELIEQVPAEPHDRRVDAVLRPAGFSNLG